MNSAAANKLVFTTQPPDLASVGTTFSTPTVVRIYDQYDNV